MENPGFEIRDEVINVEEIMAEIRENIRRRQAAGDIPPDPKSLFLSSSSGITGVDENPSIGDELSHLNSQWDISSNRFVIESHFPLIGKVIVKGRQVIHGEVCQYVDPMIIRQTGFNASSVRLLSQLVPQYTRIDQSVFRQGEEIKDLACRISRLEGDPDTRSGSRDHPSVSCEEDTIRRYAGIIPFFRGCSRVLCIGWGREDLLETLRDHHIGGQDIETNAEFVAYCRSRDLEVIQSDPISFLENLDDGSLDGIFLGDGVDLRDAGALVRLFALCFRKLKSESYIIAEAADRHHSPGNSPLLLWPVRAETLQILMSAAGFRDCETKFIPPVPGEERLKKIPETPDLPSSMQGYTGLYNYNIDLLNSVLFNAQPDCVIGKK
jgi:hypothetical protein